MAGKEKHAKRSMRSYKDSQYSFGGFKQFEKRSNIARNNNKKGLGLAVLISSLLNGFKGKRQKAGVK